MAKVSVIIPSYNHSRFLRDRLETIAKQSYNDWEAIIIDDKSLDNSVEIITKFLKDNQSFKVKHFIRNETNSGSGYNSWKKGIELAETEYIWIAETDDYAKLNFLEEQINVLEANKEAALCFCTSTYVNENKEILYDSTNRTEDLKVMKEKYGLFDQNVLWNKMPFNTYITNGSSVVFRKPVNQLSDEIFNNRLCSDIFLWSFLVQKKSFLFLNKNLNFFRRHEGSISTHLQNNKLESVFHEKAKYLNYFHQTEKHSQFINNYINHYVWNNKKDFLNTSSILKIKTDKKLKVSYFYRLVYFIIQKLLKKCKIT